MKRLFILIIIAITAVTAMGKVDLVTLPNRDTVQLTIYNSADLTLARESRSLTLNEGKNRLQFSWANTLIDPTSLDMIPKAYADKIDIADLMFPPRVRELGIWNINSELQGKAPIEISYLTSGLTWRAFYMGTLAEDEKTMRLQGYVRVTNNSGEDYENAQVRLIVGKVHMLDEIAQLARRSQPYGSPVTERQPTQIGRFRPTPRVDIIVESLGVESKETASSFSKREIKKEGLSEYFLYTIEGRDTIETGWSKRLQSFDIGDVPVVNLYKYEQQRYGDMAVRFLSFTNDTEHKMGQTPIPGGMLKVYRSVDEQQHLGYTGQSSFKYIPVDEEVELNLGGVEDVIVEPTLMSFKTKNFMYGPGICGWDEIREYKVEVRNTRDIPVKIEIKRNFSTQYWDIKNDGDYGKYEKYDLNSVKYTIELKPRSKKTFEYTLTTYHGTREEESNN